LVVGYLSDIEHGHKPPTERVADAMDAAFPERNGWFREYYEDSKSAIPPGLRVWAEHGTRPSGWGYGLCR
jgi:hypothetical protein